MIGNISQMGVVEVRDGPPTATNFPAVIAVELTGVQDWRRQPPPTAAARRTAGQAMRKPET